jgi:hypothetical protein
MMDAVPTLHMLAGAAKSVSADIDAGKLTTLDQAKTAMANNVRQYMGETPSAAPSTAPALSNSPRELSPAAKKPSETEDPFK